jgi:hypothetical protein
LDLQLLSQAKPASQPSQAQISSKPSTMLFNVPFLSLLALTSAVPLADFSRALNSLDARGKLPPFP